MRDLKLSARTLSEIEAGMKAVALYGKMEAVESGTLKLQVAFPTVRIGAVLNAPYDHVTVRVSSIPNLAPIISHAILQDEHIPEEVTYEFEDPLDGYPSKMLVTQIALIS